MFKLSFLWYYELYRNLFRQRINYSQMVLFPETKFLTIESVGGKSLFIEPKENESYFLQNDPLWAEDVIGGSNEKLASVGCTICSVAMSLNYHGYSIDPKELNEKLKNNKGYTRQGWLIWNKISEITDDKFEVIIPAKPSFEIIDNELNEGNYVITKLFINNEIPHWVLIVGKDGFEYLAKDPLNAEKAIIKLSKYESNIYSIRYIKRVD